MTDDCVVRPATVTVTADRQLMDYSRRRGHHSGDA